MKMKKQEEEEEENPRMGVALFRKEHEQESG